ncbi:MAG: hypothetical protein DIZ80_11210 [endosymbiont of Galathealinum brachiosum]|uniref:Uncharacterized protein n=1 Tax=endosymbiont of Galathealinum brachiosum TaxID=2200906 RepID=A0A370DD98_9GAMM|nr:MAG: hypothetical protein DIZ80_11210 [endosymbiont of Galathealinum brachiosum]
MNIHLKLFTNTNNEDKTKKLFSKFINNLNCEYVNLNIEPYHKGGYICSFEIKTTKEKWPEVILYSLSKAQIVGRGWAIHGNIETELDAWSNEATISGIESIQLHVQKSG